MGNNELIDQFQPVGDSKFNILTKNGSNNIAVEAVVAAAESATAAAAAQTRYCRSDVPPRCRHRKICDGLSVDVRSDPLTAEIWAIELEFGEVGGAPLQREVVLRGASKSVQLMLPTSKRNCFDSSKKSNGRSRSNARKTGFVWLCLGSNDLFGCSCRFRLCLPCFFCWVVWLPSCRDFGAKVGPKTP